MTCYSLAAIADRWRQYGRSRAVHPTLWDGSLMLSTIGPQTTSERTTCRDYSGRNNHGTLTGATHLPTWANKSYRGQSFLGVTCDGTEDHVAVASNSLFDLRDTSEAPFTICTWIYPTAWASGTDGKTLVSIGTSNYNSFYLAVDSAGKIWIIASVNGSSWGIYAKSTSKISLNAWSLVSLTRDAAGVYTMFINAASAGGSFTRTEDFRLNTYSVRIGAHHSLFTNWQFAGTLASTMIHRRVLSSQELSIIARHPLAAYEVLPRRYWFVPGGAGVTLTVAGSAVSVTSDAPTLTQHHALTVGNAVCSVTAGNVALVQHSALTVQSSQLATSSQSPALTQHNALAVAGSQCVVSSESVALTQHAALTVQGSVCAITAGNVSLTQHAALTVQDCSVALSSQSPVLAQHSILVVGDSQCAATSQEATLTQHNALAVGNATCAVTSENVVLTAHAPAVVTLSVQGSTCVVSSTSPSLTQHGALTVASSQCLVSSGNVTLAYHAAGAALILEHQTLLLAI
jgi:hypothetical protein